MEKENKKRKNNTSQPENTELSYIDEGDQLIEQGDFDGAIAVYTNAISSDPDEGFIYQLRGEAYKRKGYFDEAIADYTKAISLYDDDEDIAMGYIYRGIVHMIKNDYHNVIADADAAIKTGHLLDNAYLSRGIANMNLGFMKQATEDWKKAADLGSKSGLIKLEQYGVKYKPSKK